jgi:hypothetical protein
MRFGDDYQPYDPAAGSTDIEYVTTTPEPVVNTGQGYSVAQGVPGDYFSPPVQTTAGSPSGLSASDYLGLGKSIVSGVVDIFGRPVQPTVTAVQPGLPLWGWVVIGVGGVVVLGVIARSMKKSRSTAGYRRRSRR